MKQWQVDAIQAIDKAVIEIKNEILCSTTNATEFRGGISGGIIVRKEGRLQGKPCLITDTQKVYSRI